MKTLLIRNLKTFLSLACVAVFLSGCGKGGAKPQGPGGPGGPGGPAEVGVAAATEETVPTVIELPGRITAVRTALVCARATGILQKQLFKEGADVKADEVLFQIDPAPLQASYDSSKAALAKAEATLNLARLKADRQRALIKTQAVSKQDYDDALAAEQEDIAAVNVAKADLETAALNLGYCKVTAPISGRIGKALVTEGALVNSSTPTQLATIRQLDPIYVDFTQSSTEILKLRKAFTAGALQRVGSNEVKITLLMEDGSTYKLPGKLIFSDISVDQSTGTVTIRAEFPNPENLLLPGAFVRGRLEQALNKAVTVPQRAVTRDADGSAAVLVVNAQNQVERRTVETKQAVGVKWIVSSGLKAGEQIIVEGIQKARPGATVVPVPCEGNALKVSQATVSNNSTPTE
ncbi:MAG: efflux RND transporter periplasmic adaptor subunit [Chthoniobacteraceae bacterium]